MRSKLAITQFSLKKTFIKNRVSSQDHKFPYPECKRFIKHTKMWKQKAWANKEHEVIARMSKVIKICEAVQLCFSKNVFQNVNYCHVGKNHKNKQR